MLQEISIFERLDYLIFVKKTGTRKDLAEKFEVSERTISRWIEMMNYHGADIKFCRSKRSFMYAKPGRFVIAMEFKTGEQERVISTY